MATFKALNVESDSESADEGDNTKEIQIEEALKLYQNALKYHSLGSQSYGSAKDAYDDLFRSEIFQYPESKSEYDRLELNGSVQEANHFHDEQERLFALPSGVSDAATSTLTQILHLSYKNRGRFVLDLLHSGLQHNEASLPDAVTRDAEQALQDFSEALDKDDTDLDLWWRSARLATFVNRKRIARYCLEAALDDEDIDLMGIVRPAALDEVLLGQQLRENLRNVGDELSLALPPVSSLPEKSMVASIFERLDPYPLLPQLCERSNGFHIIEGAAERRCIRVKNSWTELGSALLQQYYGDLNESGPQSLSVIHIEILHAEANSPEKDVQPLHSFTPPVQEPSAVQQNIRDEGSGAQEVSTTSPNPRDSAHREVNDTVKETTGCTESPIISMSLPTRKRSLESAGLPENADGGRSRSKRLRARDSITEAVDPNQEKSVTIPSKMIEANLQLFVDADDWMFNVVGQQLSRMGITSLGSALDFRRDLGKDHGSDQISHPSTSLDRVLHDFKQGLLAWTEEMSMVFLSADCSDNAQRGLGTNGPPNWVVHDNSATTSEESIAEIQNDRALSDLVEHINAGYCSGEYSLVLFIESLLGGATSPYLQYRWPETLKSIVVRAIVDLDDRLYHRMNDYRNNLSEHINHFAVRNESKSPISVTTSTYPVAAQARSEEDELARHRWSLASTVQVLYELHLDAYAALANPKTEVDSTVRTAQWQRLERWAALTRDVLASCVAGSSKKNPLLLRCLWASAFHVIADPNTSRDFCIACLKDLKNVLIDWDEPTLQLPNNAVMPEISAAAADRELSRLTTMDFFHKVFGEQQEDPVDIIEHLEPLLEVERSQPPKEDQGAAATIPQIHQASCSTSPVGEMFKFLTEVSLPTRLSLWQRLADAYTSIEYQPKVVSCYLRKIELIVEELKSASHRNNQPEQRQYMLIKWLRLLDENIIPLVRIESGEFPALDLLDTNHLKSSLEACISVAKLLHVFAAFEDSIRVGASQPLPIHQTPTFSVISWKLRDIHIRIWTLIYLLYKEGIQQDPGQFLHPLEDRLDFLRGVHYDLGMRHYCHASNKLFLRLIRGELPLLGDQSKLEADWAQIIYDLYGLKCGAVAARNFYAPGGWQEHGCSPDALDRNAALKLLDYIMAQARKVHTKDLPKAEIRATIEKVQAVLGPSRPLDMLKRNKTVINAYLKTAIHPTELFRCLKGVGNISTVTVPHQQAIVAEKGWYFLMGLLNLSKFRAQKRSAPAPIEDLMVAIEFFKQDLQCDSDRWETWFRLAQAYDTLIEENVLWSVEKLNCHSEELIQIQRFAIHCYSMSLSTVSKLTEVSAEVEAKLSELHADFGTRLYASSRPPFSSPNDHEHRMEVFQPLSKEKPMSRRPGQLDLDLPFKSLDEFTCWKIASLLFRRAIAGNRDRWQYHYMLGKCLWKMHSRPKSSSNIDGPSPSQASLREVLHAFKMAIETLPHRKDSRSEPTLEPHYKLISVVHKSVPEEGSSILKEGTRYGRHSTYNIDGGWHSYIMSVLRELRQADRANWHHRISFRIATLKAENINSMTHASAEMAKSEMTQQIFTKTMALQVWKPENERPGRHFVFTSQYLCFLVRILVVLKDRITLEALLKRVRKKTNDFLDHQQVWTETAYAYEALLRELGTVPEKHEDYMFASISTEEFQGKAARLEEWAHSDSEKPLLFSILREAVDFRKLNNGLAKPDLFIQDLIGDAYAALYERVCPTLTPPSPAPDKPQPMERATPMITIPDAGPVNMMSVTSLITYEGGQGLVGTLLPKSPPPKERAPHPNKKGATRLEVRKKAEALFARSSGAATMTRGRGDTSSRRASLVVDTNRESPIEHGGSEIEDADNESELSDVQDEDLEPVEKPRRSMFPGLAARVLKPEADETGADEEGDDDERDDPDGDDEAVHLREEALEEGPS